MSSVHLLLATASLPDTITFALAAAICIVGSLGVVVSTNPVHSALMLVMTLFGVAVLFVEEDAQFLAAVQVIVYAGAIVVLFLFVIMLLGVDRSESIAADPLKGQRLTTLILGALVLAEVVLLGRGRWPTGARSTAGTLRQGSTPNVNVLGRSIFTTFLLPFEITSALLVIAIIGAVVLARRPTRPAPEVTGPATEEAVEEDPAGSPSPTGAAEADAGEADPDTGEAGQGTGEEEAETGETGAPAWVPAGRAEERSEP